MVKAKKSNLIKDELLIEDFSSIVHFDDEELVSAKTDFGTRSNTYPPTGETVGTLSLTVRNQSGNPVPGIRVQFSISYVNPGGSWRSAKGLNALYKSVKGDGAKAERLARQGIVKVIGSLSSKSVLTDRNGVASVRYRSSHIGSDFKQAKIAQERITATLPNGRSKSIVLKIGWTGLSKIQTVQGGLRIVGARGQAVQPDLKKYLANLGNAVKKAGWPHPVTVTAASLRWGGQYPPHFTHKHGGTLDLRPMSTDGQRTYARASGQSKANYDFRRTKKLIAVLKKSGGIVYFNGKDAGGIFKDKHDDHIHVTWLKSNVYYEKSIFVL